MTVPAPIAPLVASFFVDTILTTTAPADPTAPTNGSFVVQSVLVSWTGYNSAGVSLGDFQTLLQNVDLTTPINPAATCGTFGQFASTERALLHAQVKQIEGLTNAA